jgi:hypothetical protein
MLRYLPGRKELVIFAVLSVVCALIVWAMPSRDLATSAATFPIFVGCTVFSLWKHGRLRATDVSDE